MIKTLNDLIEKAKNQKTRKLAVAACQDYEVLKSVIEAAKEGIVEPVLIGDKEKTLEIAKENGIDIEKYELVDEPELKEAAERAVKYVSSGKADFLMKGIIDTSILLKEVLNKEYGLRTDSLLSHVMVYEVPTYHKLIFLTDGGMNIEPSLEDKVKITKNAVKVAKALGNKNVKVAVLAAKEKVNPKMIATVHAVELEKMNKDGEFGEEVIVDGPLALDLAISKEAAKIKGYESEVAGDADILLVPNIEMGNGVGKSLTYFAKASSAGIIMGAKAPVILVSRADTHQAKLNSIALGSVVAG
ncbi:bifunctional enoyl-CoA hydratase/phosphate acetyltransferase [Thermohalobacter berrensis]|uniref:Phosphate butyryltransferase n=1 Tax=Thermohalobacter berrensis TaxID=99594 RepID=A0A419T2X8_9FIRM|nr:bifunctional enoyl-CoA hydratase/phosphate acetyltransferase [Thermohalobacter berrensis]RKD31811.1 phosphate butyryltransferase [Thermohalobacter berrensis]